MVSPIQFSVWSIVWSNLGQTWSNLVKALRTLGNVSRTMFWGFLGIVDPTWVKNGLVKPRSNLVKALWTLGNVSWTTFWGFLDIVSPSRVRNSLVKLGQLRSNLVNPGQTWSTLVKLGQISGNVSRTSFLRLFWCGGHSSGQAGSVGATSFCVPTPEKFPGVKMELWQLGIFISWFSFIFHYLT